MASEYNASQQPAATYSTAESVPQHTGPVTDAKILEQPVTGQPVEQTVTGQPVSDAEPVVAPGFCLDYDVYFTLRESLDVRDRMMFEVRDARDNVHFRVVGDRYRGQRYLLDTEGRIILAMKQKTFSAHSKWRIFTHQDMSKTSKVATVKPHMGTSTIHAEVRLKGAVQARKHPGLTDKDKRRLRHDAPDYFVQGPPQGAAARTYCQLLKRGANGLELAAEMQQLQLERYQRGAPIPRQRDAYTVHTLPGVDTALALALCVVMDDTSFRQQYPYNSYGPYGYGYGAFGPYGYGAFGPYAGWGLGMGLALPLLLTAAWF
jgi:uncharacterized protein YxjI